MTPILPNTLLLQYNRHNRYEWYETIYYNIINGDITYIILTLLLIFFIIGLFRRTQKKLHSHWNTLLNDFSFSSQEFYQLVEEELKSQGIKSVRCSRVDLPEGGIGSLNRMYLRINWKNYRYDMCGAPFGKGFFVSWWLMQKTPILKILISKIPFIGTWLANKLYRLTYYKIDTASMFMTYAHQAVLTVIENITNDKGVKALSEHERKPILNDIFRR